MLRLTLDWFSRHRGHRETNKLVGFAQGARWYSEARLRSQFAARHQGDSLGESPTQADGLVGHFDIGSRGRADASVSRNAKQALVVEAKLGSPLSRGTRNAPSFDQAARSVACLAEMISRSKQQPQRYGSLGFLLLAPKQQISRGDFAREMNPDSIRSKVERRVGEYGDRDKERWFKEWFLPVIGRARIECLSWERIIGHIRSEDSEFGKDLHGFYTQCLRFNGK